MDWREDNRRLANGDQYPRHYHPLRRCTRLAGPGRGIGSAALNKSLHVGLLENVQDQGARNFCPVASEVSPGFNRIMSLMTWSGSVIVNDVLPSEVAIF